MAREREVLRLIVEAIQSAETEADDTAGLTAPVRAPAHVKESERLAVRILRRIEEAGFVIVPEEDLDD